MSRHRLKAFTIMEITVAMLVTAVVIAITYTTYSIVSLSYINYHKRSDRMASIVLVDRLLKKDFSNADTIFKTDSGIMFKSKDLFAKYEIDTGFIVRTSGISDTFKMHIQDITMQFENKPVTSISPQTEQNRVDDLSFSILFENEIIPYHYHKDYSSENLIERNPNAIN